MTKTTFNAKNWNKSTPPKWRNIGDALLALSVAVNSAIVILPIPEPIKIWVMASSTIVGGLGKFLTKLFNDSEDDSKQLNKEDALKKGGQ
jgi:hypothetical protein